MTYSQFDQPDGDIIEVDTTPASVVDNDQFDAEMDWTVFDDDREVTQSRRAYTLDVIWVLVLNAAEAALTGGPLLAGWLSDRWEWAMEPDATRAHRDRVRGAEARMAAAVVQPTSHRRTAEYKARRRTRTNQDAVRPELSAAKAAQRQHRSEIRFRKLAIWAIGFLALAQCYGWLWVLGPLIERIGLGLGWSIIITWLASAFATFAVDSLLTGIAYMVYSPDESLDLPKRATATPPDGTLDPAVIQEAYATALKAKDLAVISVTGPHPGDDGDQWFQVASRAHATTQIQRATPGANVMMGWDRRLIDVRAVAAKEGTIHLYRRAMTAEDRREDTLPENGLVDVIDNEANTSVCDGLTVATTLDDRYRRIPARLRVVGAQTLLTGGTGAGKSSILAHGLISAMRDPMVYTFLVSMKGSGLGQYNWLRGHLNGVIAGNPVEDEEFAERVYGFLTMLLEWCDIRGQWLDQAGLGDSVSAETMYHPEYGPYLYQVVVGFEEFQLIRSVRDKALSNAIMARVVDVIKVGRSSGVSLILATQKNDAHHLPTTASGSISSHFAGYTKDRDDAGRVAGIVNMTTPEILGLNQFEGYLSGFGPGGKIERARVDVSQLTAERAAVMLAEVDEIRAAHRQAGHGPLLDMHGRPLRSTIDPLDHTDKGHSDFPDLPRFNSEPGTPEPDTGRPVLTVVDPPPETSGDEFILHEAVMGAIVDGLQIAGRADGDVSWEELLEILRADEAADVFAHVTKRMVSRIVRLDYEVPDYKVGAAQVRGCRVGDLIAAWEESRAA